MRLDFNYGFVLVGNVLERLKEIPDGTIHCCVTSPPYWGLRQYLFDGAVVLRADLSPEERAHVEAELTRRGVKPRLSSKP